MWFCSWTRQANLLVSSMLRTTSDSGSSSCACLAMTSASANRCSSIRLLNCSTSSASLFCLSSLSCWPRSISSEADCCARGVRYRPGSAGCTLPSRGCCGPRGSAAVAATWGPTVSCSTCSRSRCSRARAPRGSCLPHFLGGALFAGDIPEQFVPHQALFGVDCFQGRARRSRRRRPPTGDAEQRQFIAQACRVDGSNSASYFQASENSCRAAARSCRSKATRPCRYNSLP